MTLKWRKEKAENPKSANQPSSRTTEIYNLLKDSLQLMREKSMDRLVLSVSEQPRDMELVRKFGGWVRMDNPKLSPMLRFYPYEILPKEELEFVNKHVSYQAISLVLAKTNTDYGTDYLGDGVELANRSILHWEMPEFKKSVSQRFATEFIVYQGEDMLHKFADVLTNAHPKFTAAMLRENIEQAIGEYSRITVELMENAGVHRSIERLGEVGRSCLPEKEAAWLFDIMLHAKRQEQSAKQQEPV